MNTHDKNLYVAPNLMVDAVIFELIDNRLHVLLIERSKSPFKGMRALPGGFNPKGETTRDALKRIVHEKAGLILGEDLPYVEQLYTFDKVARDPRGHAVSVTYMACGRNITPKNDMTKATFFPVDQLPDLAYDHTDIIHYGQQRLITRLTHSNAVSSFLPPEFSLTELQQAYEAIFGREFDKRNFRKKFLSFNMIQETETMRRDGAHRPARFYKFNSTHVESLGKHFI